MTNALPDRWRAIGPYVAALLIFLTSRMVVYFAIQFATRFTPRNNVEAWDGGTYWYHHLLRWDASWYYSILLNGYHFSGDNLVQQPVIFFPLYPLIARFVSFVPGVDGYKALLIVANVAAVLAVLALFNLVRADRGDEVALTTVAFLSFFPTSFFLSTGYAESLTLLLMLCFFLLLRKEYYIAAATVAGLALAARATAILLLPVLLWEFWRRRGNHRNQIFLYALLSMLATSGLLVYMIFLWAAFGHPLAFATNRAAWMGGNTIGTGLLDAVMLKPIQLKFPWSLGPTLWDPWFFASFFLLSVVYWRRLSPSLALFGLGVVLLPYLMLSGGQGFVGMSRFLLLAFPVFIIAADLTKGRVWFGASLLGLSAAMLFAYTAMFSQSYWVG